MAAILLSWFRPAVGETRPHPPCADDVETAVLCKAGGHVKRVTDAVSFQDGSAWKATWSGHSPAVGFPGAVVLSPILLFRTVYSIELCGEVPAAFSRRSGPQCRPTWQSS